MLLEMAKSRKELAKEIQEKSEETIIHLVKYYAVPDYDLRSHWEKEIFTFMHNISLLKNNNDFPNTKFIIDNSVGTWLDGVERKYSSILKPYLECRKYSPEVNSFITDYMNWLAEMLSTNGYIDLDSVRNKLQWLIVLYDE